MKGTRLPPDWSPDPNLLAWSKGRRPDLDMADTIESFKDYWCAKSGQSATKLDWRRTFRNWVRSTRAAPRQWQPPAYRPNPSPPAPDARRAPRTDLTDQERAENRARVAALMRGLGK